MGKAADQPSTLGGPHAEGTLGKLRPEPAREPLPPPKVYAPTEQRPQPEDATVAGKVRVDPL